MENRTLYLMKMSRIKSFHFSSKCISIYVQIFVLEKEKKFKDKNTKKVIFCSLSENQTWPIYSSSWHQLHTRSWVVWESDDHWSACFYWFELVCVLNVLMMMKYQPEACFIGCRFLWDPLQSDPDHVCCSETERFY